MKNINFFLIFCLMSFSVYATKSHVGRVIKKQGDAQLYFNPAKKVSGKGPHVLYNGVYYNFKPIKLGQKIQNGNIIKTGKDAKLKIVYKNGDQFNIGEGTSFEIKWANNNKPPKGNLIYGSIRGIISKKGARSGLVIRSKSAVMGVRGTDFNFTQRGTSGKSAISVLRGKVEVADTKKPKKKINLDQGKTAELQVASTKKKAQATTLLVSKTTKQDLIKIQKDSKIEKAKEDKIKDTKILKEIAKLEEKAVKTTLNDIKEYQPELYETIKDKKIKDIDSINTTVVSKAFEKAPVKKVKPGFDDYDLDLDEDVYDKYFSIE